MPSWASTIGRAQQQQAVLQAMQRTVNSSSMAGRGLTQHTRHKAQGISLRRWPALLAGSAQAAPPHNCRQGQGHR